MAEHEPGMATIVVGTQWGDEGKGKGTDRLLSQNPDITTVVKPQGGHNAGHSVSIDGEDFDFHGLPSGLVHPNLMNVIGASVYTNPIGFFEEADKLWARHNIAVAPNNVMVSLQTHLVEPGHIYLDERREAGVGGQGSTKQGVAFAAATKYQREGIRAIQAAGMSLSALHDYAHERLSEVRSMAGDTKPGYEEADQIRRWAAAVRRLTPYVDDGVGYIREQLAEGHGVLAEGAQGLWLDIDHGAHPYNTSSHIGPGGILNGMGIAPDQIGTSYGMMKAFKSRVGGGPFVTEFDDPELAIRMAGRPGAVDHESGTTTGRIRRLGYLDIPEMRQMLGLMGRSAVLFMTKLDAMNNMGDTIKIATHYMVDGKRQDIASVDTDTMARSVAQYEELPGWTEDISHCTSFDQFPPEAQGYVHRIEELLDREIDIIGVGPDRNQTIDRRVKVAA